MVRSSFAVALFYSASGTTSATKATCKADGTCSEADEVTMLHVNALISDDIAETTCRSFTCGAPLTLRSDAASTVCASGICHEQECCQAACKDFTCAKGFIANPDSANTVCADAVCTNEDCCQARICCKAMNARCLACAEGSTIEEYCENNPMTAGCEQFRQPVYEFLGEGYCRPSGCNTYESKCRSNGYRHSITSDDHKSHDECQKACDLHVECVGYAFHEGEWCYVYTSGGETPEGWTSYKQEYFDVAQTTGPGHGAECYRRIEGTGCCRAMTAKCLACAEGASVREYCAKNPDAVGCDELPALPVEPDVCGGAGVHHSTCRSQAKKDMGLDCFYVAKAFTSDCGLESCSDTCKQEQWGCYQRASLPRSCVEDDYDSVQRQFHVHVNHAIAGECLQKCMWFAGMGDSESCESMCNDMQECDGFGWHDEQGGKCMFMTKAEVGAHLSDLDTEASWDVGHRSAPKCFIRESWKEWYARQQGDGTIEKDC